MTGPVRNGQNIWIDTDRSFIGATWYWPSQGDAGATAVVIVPGIVHEERTMASGVVALAEALADAGLPALLMDLHGTSQSDGRIEDADIGDYWRDDIRSAVRHARDNGAARVIVVGVRLGFPLAAEALADEPIDALVAWAPIASGRRYVRELKVLQRADDAEAAAAGTIAIGGFSIPASVLDRISKLNLEKIMVHRSSHVLLRDMPEGLDAAWLTLLKDSGVTTEQQESADIQPWLFSADDQPALPHDDVAILAQWCRALHDGQSANDPVAIVRPTSRPVIEFDHQGRRVRETFVEVGPDGLTAVLSEPADTPSGHPVRLLMSTVGPGRTFADFARDEASRGNSSLRFDFAGFGTSGRGDAAQGGELYTDGGARDVAAVVDHLRAAGHGEIYTLGFCAGAWSMLQAGTAPELRAAVAINVALYRQPGPAAPVRKKRARRYLSRVPGFAVARKVVARFRRAASERREPVEWLIRLCGTDTRVLLAYAQHDPGLTYLNGQLTQGLESQLGNPFALRTYAGLGHLAEGPSARAQLFRDITKFFAELDRERLALPEQL